MNENNKITVKDLINIGVFTALYFVVFFAVSLVGFIPILLVLLPLICAVATGIPFMLFLSKTQKFGMVTIMSVLLALLSMLMGRPWVVLLIALATGLIADFILKAGNYKRVKSCILSCGVFSLWMMGMVLPMFFGYRDNYLAGIAKGYGQAYADTITRLTPDWMFYVLTVLCFAGGILGGLLGSAVLKKHFKKAGMA